MSDHADQLDIASITERVTAELHTLVGQPISGCWRATNMQVFEFGPSRQTINRRGEKIDVCDLRLHVQCRWRFLDSKRILFGRDDLNYPADENTSIEDFDWDTSDSVLDVKQRAWFAEHRDKLPKVIDARGLGHGGFRAEFEGGFALEGFPCESRRGEYSEHWRLFGHREDGSHFVVTGDGIERDNQ